MGTVEGNPDVAGRVKVALKGGTLGVDLGRWVKPGEVMSLARVSRATGVAIPWSYLVVESAPVDGVCTCRFFSRYRGVRTEGLRHAAGHAVQEPALRHAGAARRALHPIY